MPSLWLIGATMPEIGSQEYYDQREQHSHRAIRALIAENARLRAALLLIREHKLPYPGYSGQYGSNGVRDHFIRIAQEALDVIYD